MNSKLTTPDIIGQEDEGLDLSLRPKRLQEFEGQAGLKKTLKIFLQAARKRGEPIEHVLIYGPPGLGKTTLAYIIAHEMGVGIKTTSGPAIERPGDLASILTSLEERDVLFIDEIHRLNKVVEETLYPAMEDFFLDIVLGKGPSARTLKLDLPKVTIVGATTRIGLLSSPLRDRFGLTHRLEFYSQEELFLILKRSAKVLETSITDTAASQIAERSRATPRVANRLLKRVRDFAQVKMAGLIDEKAVSQALELLGVDKLGLDPTDRLLLHTLIEKFGGEPVGLETLAAAIAEDSGTVEEVVEPFLIQSGLIKRTPRGRVATDRAFRHLGIEPRRQDQQKLV